MWHVCLLKAQPTGLQRAHRPLVVPLYNPNELCGHRTVVIGDAQGIPCDGPLLAEYAEVNLADAGPFARGCEDAKGRGVQLVSVCDDVMEARQVIAEGRVLSMPSDDIEGGMGLRVREEAAGELEGDFPGGEVGVVAWIFKIERRDRVLEVADMGEAVGAEHAELGEDEARTEDLKGVAGSGDGRQ